MTEKQIVSLEGKFFAALLDSLVVKKWLLGDEGMTEELIYSELYAGSPETTFEQATLEMHGLDHFIRSVSKDPTTFSDRLNDGSWAPGQATLLQHFWAAKREQILAKILSECTWNDHLRALSYRVDSVLATKDNPNVNSPVALFEIATTSGHAHRGEGGDKGVARFMMDKAQINDTLGVLQEIEASIDAAIST